MTPNNIERADVLALKLKGLSPQDIAEKLGITVTLVMKHDKEIKKMMAKGDAEELASMTPEELEFAQRAVGQMLPYMRKSLDTVSKSANTLQTIHTTALDVAERIFNLIDRKLEDEKLSIKELKELSQLFADTYAVLYNKNGIQIINLLADSTPMNNEAEKHKEDMRKELLVMRDKALNKDVIDVEADEDEVPNV